MADFYFSEAGDIKLDANRDIASTVDDAWRTDAQHVYVRIMTETGDWLSYPSLGCNMDALYGEPQSPATGEFGKKIINEAINREGVFQGKEVTVEAIPTGHQSIRFDIYVKAGHRSDKLLSVEQDLGVI